jgi:hypothetical protein
MAGRLKTWWDRFRQVASVRSALQWIGVWEWIVAGMSAFATCLWSHFSHLVLLCYKLLIRIEITPVGGIVKLG